MTQAMQTALLTTVNAPYQNYLDAGGLSVAISNGDIKLGQICSFFTETDANTQKAFAAEFGISHDKLSDVAKDFSNWSGQEVELAA